MARVINQEANYTADFGAIFRSSAIFYKPCGVKATISFSNYWKFKNSLDVGVVATFRTMDGALVARRELKFEEGNVINIEVLEIEEGSVEIEAFSSKNLRIPYAAIMGIYETENSVSMVHSYGRNHSLIELEDDKAITEGRESCWTLRPSPNLRNRSVFHNGHIALEKQIGLFTVTKSDGNEKTIEFQIPRLEPFQTFVFEAEEIFPNLKDYLDGDIGWATVHFESRSGFTRLLVMWTDQITNEVQVTHSNFDYSSHQTNLVESTKPAYMALPSVKGEVPDVIVYPKFSRGVYCVNGDSEFSKGIVVKTKESELAFTRKDGDLPSRIVTAAIPKPSDNVTLPFECSLGVVHEKRPPKRFHWFLVSSELPTTIHLTHYEKIYPSEGNIELVLRMYSAISKDVEEVLLSYDSLSLVPKEIALDSLFDISLLNGFGYLTIFSHYGGFWFYSSLQKKNSLTLEHSF